MNKELQNTEQISLDSFLDTLSDTLEKIDFENHYTGEIDLIMKLRSTDYHSIQSLVDILHAMPDNPEHYQFMMLKRKFFDAV